MAGRLRQHVQHSLSGGYKTTLQQMAKGMWPCQWESGARSRLPDHYKRRLIELHTIQPKPVHYRPDLRKWTVDEFGVRKPVYNVAIPVLYPNIANEGLWAGEGIIKGYRKKNNNPDKERAPNFWKPKLSKRVFYSEILDRWMAITVTNRALLQIDEAFGFDSYILMTHQVDLQSKLGMNLKKEMLTVLSQKSLYPDDAEKQEKIYNKYKEFIIPEEEIEWLGLSIDQAEQKQMDVEYAAREAAVKPFKYIYAQQLIEKLKAGGGEEESETGSSWMSRLSPFTGQDKTDKS